VKLELIKRIQATYVLWRYWTGSILIYDKLRLHVGKKPKEILVIYPDCIQQIESKEWEQVPSDVIRDLKGFIEGWEKENEVD
jgi:hypothetical protein